MSGGNRCVESQALCHLNLSFCSRPSPRDLSQTFMKGADGLGSLMNRTAMQTFFGQVGLQDMSVVTGWQIVSDKDQSEIINYHDRWRGSSPLLTCLSPIIWNIPTETSSRSDVPTVIQPRVGLLTSNTPDLAVASFLHTETISCSSQAERTWGQTTGDCRVEFCHLKPKWETVMGWGSDHQDVETGQWTGWGPGRTKIHTSPRSSIYWSGWSKSRIIFLNTWQDLYSRRFIFWHQYNSRCQFDVFKSLIKSCQGYFVFLDKYFRSDRQEAECVCRVQNLLIVDIIIKHSPQKCWRS